VSRSDAKPAGWPSPEIFRGAELHERQDEAGHLMSVPLEQRAKAEDGSDITEIGEHHAASSSRTISGNEHRMTEDLLEFERKRKVEELLEGMAGLDRAAGFANDPRKR
jgi:hypothetical protein